MNQILMKFIYKLKIHTKQSISIYNPYTYQSLINKMKLTGLKYLSDSKVFIEQSNNMSNIYKSIEEYDQNKKWKMSLVFDDMIVDMLSNKKTSSNNN